MTIINVDIPEMVPFESRVNHRGYDIPYSPLNDGSTPGDPHCFICLKLVNPHKAHLIHRSHGETALPYGARYIDPEGTNPGGDPMGDGDGFGGLGFPFIGPECRKKIPADAIYPPNFLGVILAHSEIGCQYYGTENPQSKIKCPFCS